MMSNEDDSIPSTLIGYTLQTGTNISELRDPFRYVLDEYDNSQEIISPLVICQDFLKNFSGVIREVMVIVESNGKTFFQNLAEFMRDDYLVKGNSIKLGEISVDLSNVHIHFVTTYTITTS